MTTDDTTEPAVGGAGYSVARYLAIDEVRDPSIASDGQLLFRADTSGTPQVWTVDEPGGWPRRLTPHEERISTVAASPTAPVVVFGMDTGSDERDQLYASDLDTGVERALTDTPTAKHVWGAWGPDGEEIFFTANRTDRGRFDVYALDVTEPDAEPQLVCEGPGGWFHVDAAGPEGNRLAVVDPHASFDATLSILDRDSGETQSFGSEGSATYEFPVFDGAAGLYCVTNDGRDTAYLGRFDLDTGELIPVAGDDGDHSGAPGTDAWDVDGFAFDRDTGRAAFTRNVGGYSELTVGTLDGTTFVPTATLDPEGIVEDLTLGPNGDRLAVTHTAPDQPYNVRVYDLDEVTDGVDATPSTSDTATGDTDTATGD
ncbi:MAG: TolB family protein, partial [Halobaculum sp.]